MTNPDSSAVSWRSLAPKDEDALSSLYDSAFMLSPETHFLDDFPAWDPSLSVRDRRQWGGFLNQSLVAAACSRSVRLHEVAAPALLIGGVAVHPDHQKKGFASEAITRLLSEEKNLEEKIAILWGGEKSLYGRFGFKDAGIQKRAPLSSMKLENLNPQISTGFSGDIETSLRSSKAGGIVVDSFEIALIHASKSIQWVHATLDGKTAFAAVGKGIDLPGIIHTWGGDPQVLESLLSVVKSSVSEHLEILWHPKHEEKYAFLSGARTHEKEVLAMVRVGNQLTVDVDTDALWFWGVDSA